MTWILIEEGTDLTEILKIQKYEKPIPSNLMGRVKGNFPLFIPKTDQERVQNLSRKEFDLYADDTFEVTTKLDGSSMTVYFNEGKVGVCSRNFDLEETEDNLYWQVFHKSELNKVNLEGYALQGELIGEGVNGNKSKIKGHYFYLFDIYSILEKRYLTPKERFKMFSELKLMGVNIFHVPILHIDYHFPTKEEALQMADHEFNNLPAEGIVFKSNTGKFSFKAISNSYLISNDE